MTHGRGQSKSERSLPLSRKLLFSAIATLILVALLEVGLMLAGVRPVIWDEDPYVGFESAVELYRVTGDGSHFETASNKLALFNPQSFARHKAPGAYRIFTLGGSTTYGRPFDDATSFSGWLRTYLQAAAPQTDWEVINAGAISYASYRVAKLMEELLDYQPDLFVIYSGNNEFLERRSYGDIIEEHAALTRTRLALSHSRLYALAQRVRRTRQRQAREAYRLKGEVDEILNRSTGLSAYRRDDPLSRQILAHYRFNIHRMLDMAASRGARVVLVTLPVNEKDFSPFKSQPGDGTNVATFDRMRALLGRAADSESRGTLDDALAALTEAVALDPHYAETHFRLGKVLLGLGKTDAATDAFRRAVVEDVCPLRALPVFNDALREIAASRDVLFLDFEELLRSRMSAEHGHRSPGNEYFLDHVHPTVEANGLLARALVDRLAGAGIARVGRDWHARVGAEVMAEVEGRADDKARAVAFKNLSKVLIWAGKKQEAEQYVRRAELLLQDDWEVHYNAGVISLDTGEAERALDSFAEAIRLNPAAAEAHDYLGAALAELGRLDEAVASGERAVALGPDRASAHNNLSTYHADAGRMDRARDSAERAIALAPDFSEAYNNLGNALFAEGRLDPALKAYERAIVLRPGYAEALLNRGLVLGAANRLSEAVASFTAALEHPGGAFRANLGLGRAHLGLGDPASATIAFKAAVTVAPSEPEGYTWLSRAYLVAGRREDGVQTLQQGLRVAPRSPDLLHLSAQLAASEERFEDSLRIARLALDAYPESAAPTVRADELHHSLASMLFLTQRVEEGLQHLREALALNPENVLALNDMGLIYENEGQLAQAVRHYERAVLLDPAFDVAARNLERARLRLASGRTAG